MFLFLGILRIWREEMRSAGPHRPLAHLDAQFLCKKSAILVSFSLFICVLFVVLDSGGEVVGHSRESDGGNVRDGGEKFSARRRLFDNLNRQTIDKITRNEISFFFLLPCSCVGLQ